MSWCDLYLTFDLVVVKRMVKSCLGYTSETITCRNVILGKNICCNDLVL